MRKWLGSYRIMAILSVLMLAMAFGSSPALGGNGSDAQGPPDRLELERLHNRVFPLFAIAGVVYTDVIEETGRLEVGIARQGVTGEVESELGRLNVPRAQVDIVVTEPIVQVETLRDRVRPLQGGLQIAFDIYACTLGFNGIRDGVAGFVVNSHCTSTQGGVENTLHYQPTVDGSNLIGTEIADPDYTKEKCPPGLKGKKCRYSDSAYSQLDANVAADLGFIKRTDGVNNGSINVVGSFQISDVASTNATTGAVLNKVGRTTGQTQGTVTNSCANVGVSGTNIVQLCQDIVKADVVIVGGGDSGSPVFKVTNSPNQYDVALYGILWGGSTDGKTLVYSPMANVQRSDELGPLTVIPAAPVATGTISGTVTNSSDGSVISGARVSVDTGQSATTAADGTYSIAGVPTGGRSVTASADGFVSQTKPATVTENQTTIVDFALSPVPTGTVAGNVTESDGVTAIGGATVRVDTGQSATTASDGTYTISDVPTGDRSVTASADGYESQTKAATVSENQTTVVDFALSAVTTATTVTVDSITYATEGGKDGLKHLSITVALVDNLGNPVSGASVSITLSHESGSSWSGTGTTGTSGTVTFSLKNAPSGCYTTKVTGVTASGLTWDGATPANGVCK